MSLKEQLNDIDLQLEVMPKKNRQMVYASVVLALVAFSYYFFGLGLQEECRVKETKVVDLEAKLAESKVSLYQSKIAKSQQKVLVLNKAYEDEKHKETALRVKLERMDYLSSDAKGLADILDRLLKRSVTLGVSIDKILIEEEEKPYKAHIEQKGTINIHGQASFRAVLKLLRFIESQEALIEVKNVHFDLEDGKNRPAFVIMITGYGIHL